MDSASMIQATLTNMMTSVPSRAALDSMHLTRGTRQATQMKPRLQLLGAAKRLAVSNSRLDTEPIISKKVEVRGVKAVHNSQKELNKLS